MLSNQDESWDISLLWLDLFQRLEIIIIYISFWFIYICLLYMFICICYYSSSSHCELWVITDFEDPLVEKDHMECIFRVLCRVEKWVSGINYLLRHGGRMREGKRFLILIALFTPMVLSHHLYLSCANHMLLGRHHYTLTNPRARSSWFLHCILPKSPLFP